MLMDSTKANKVNKGEKKMPDKKPKKDDKKKTVPKKPVSKKETSKVAEKPAKGEAPAVPKKKK
jgi:hypothetical protein